MLAAGLGLALLSTAALNGGFYLQHEASQGLPDLTVRHPFASLSALFTNLRWVIGFVTGLAGWALYIVALDLAPLSLVQATAAGGMGLLALLVRIGGVRLSARERVAVAASVGGLLLVGLSLPAGTPHTATAGWGLPLIWVLASLLVAGVAAVPAAGALRPGAGLAVASGLLYAAGDVATKAAVSGISPVYLFAIMLPLCHGLAFVSLQLAFQRGSTLATAGVSSLLNNLLPIVAGFVVFHEQMPAGLPGALRGLGFAGAVLGAALLAATGRPGKANTPDSDQAQRPGVKAASR
jgi:hypothetical protein